MVRYRLAGNKLVVQGLNSAWVLGLNILFMLLQCCSTFILIVSVLSNATDGVQITIFLLSLAILAIQYYTFRSYQKHRKRIIVFDMKRGFVEFLISGRRKKKFIGKAKHWYFQQALHKSHRGGIYVYYAVLVGSRGKCHIGLSALTIKGLLIKLKRINEYYNLEHEVSKSPISTTEIMKHMKTWGGL